MEQILKQFNYSSYWVSYSGELYKNILHPYKTAEIRFTTGEILGIFGQINPILAKKYNISPNLYLFEFNFDLIRYYSKRNMGLQENRAEDDKLSDEEAKEIWGSYEIWNSDDE